MYQALDKNSFCIYHTRALTIFKLRKFHISAHGRSIKAPVPASPLSLVAAVRKAVMAKKQSARARLRAEFIMIIHKH